MGNYNHEKVFVTATILVFASVFVVVSAIPIIGPIFVSYSLGTIRDRYKNRRFAKKHFLLSMAIGETFFFIIISSLVNYAAKPEQLKIAWLINIACFATNYLLSLAFYFWGRKNAKQKTN